MSTTAAEASATKTGDPRWTLFCTRSGPEIFRPVAYPTDVWTEDPFDVDTIHAEARDCFQRLLDRAASDEAAHGAGRVLLLKGESGSGKTHLMRAFRGETHRLGRGYFGYLQMTSSTNHYGRYILQKLIDSLDKPYAHSLSNNDETTGLVRLSTSVAETLTDSSYQLERLRGDELDREEFGALVEKLADRAQERPTLRGVDLDLLRAMLALQSGRIAVRNRVVKYLRAEALSDNDREWLGGVSSLDGDAHSLEMVQRLARLMWSTQRAALVLCVDQLEDIYKAAEAAEKFRRAVEGLLHIAAHVKSAVIVIACLEDYYTALAQHLDKSARDRLESDPAPITLQAGRDLDDIKRIVGKHLEYLWTAGDAEFDPNDPTYPIPLDAFKDNVRQRARSVLQKCKDVREHAITHGALPDGWQVAPARRDEQDLVVFDEKWSDHRAEFAAPDLDDEVALAKILAGGIERVDEELHGNHEFVTEVNDNRVKVAMNRDGVRQNGGVVVGVCLRSSKGGGLGKQLDAVIEDFSGNDLKPIVVRMDDKPPGKASATYQKYAEVLKRDGKFVVVNNSDWRALAAYPEFHKRNSSLPGYEQWRRTMRPLGEIRSLRTILDLDALDASTPAPDAPKPSRPITTTTSGSRDAGGSEPAVVAPVRGPDAIAPPPKKESDKLSIGVTNDRRAQAVELDPATLTRHAAFIGSTGSGKTTAALNVIEQLLLRGVPTVVVDRKGDLAAYAERSRWATPIDDPELEERRKRLLAEVEVVLLTPGHADGRPIRLSAAPEGLRSLSTADRQQTAVHAAHSLGEMLKYKPIGPKGQRISILIKALEQLIEEEERVTLKALADHIDEASAEIAVQLGKVDLKHFRGLAQDLHMLRINKPSLFPDAGDPLDGDFFFGRGTHGRPNKTRLTIVSTKFLPNVDEMQFWVAQFCMELTRWAGRRPEKKLQAAVFFDEADVYLPATAKPASKEPMENLLKRARSTGLSVLLGTQSPGDFDYKCRENINTWMIGRIKEKPALDKLKPLLEREPGDALGSLAEQKMGEFYLVGDGASGRVKCRRNVVKTEQLSDSDILEVARSNRPDQM